MIIVLHNVLFRKQVVKLQLFLETTITKRPKVCKSHFLPLFETLKLPGVQKTNASHWNIGSTLPLNDLCVLYRPEHDYKRTLRQGGKTC